MAVGRGAIAALPHLPVAALSGAKYPLIEMLDWDDFAAALDARGLREEPRLFIAATRWLDAGKIDYALHGNPPVLCLSDDPRGFGLIRDPQDFVGWNALIVAPGLTLEEARQRFGRISTPSSRWRPSRFWLAASRQSPCKSFALRISTTRRRSLR